MGTHICVSFISKYTLNINFLETVLPSLAGRCDSNAQQINNNQRILVTGSSSTIQSNQPKYIQPKIRHSNQKNTAKIETKATKNLLQNSQKFSSQIYCINPQSLCSQNNLSNYANLQQPLINMTNSGTTKYIQIAPAPAVVPTVASVAKQPISDDVILNTLSTTTNSSKFFNYLFYISYNFDK